MARRAISSALTASKARTAQATPPPWPMASMCKNDGERREPTSDLTLKIQTCAILAPSISPMIKAPRSPAAMSCLKKEKNARRTTAQSPAPSLISRATQAGSVAMTNPANSTQVLE